MTRYGVSTHTTSLKIVRTNLCVKFVKREPLLNTKKYFDFGELVKLLRKIASLIPAKVQPDSLT